MELVEENELALQVDRKKCKLMNKSKEEDEGIGRLSSGYEGVILPRHRPHPLFTEGTKSVYKVWPKLEATQSS